MTTTMQRPRKKKSKKADIPWLAHEAPSRVPNAETEEALRDSLAGCNMETIALEDLRRQWNEA